MNSVGMAFSHQKQNVNINTKQQTHWKVQVNEAELSFQYNHYHVLCGVLDLDKLHSKQM